MKIGLAISLLIVIAFLIGRGSKQDVVESGDHHAQNQQVSRTRDTKNPSSRRQGSIGEDARATLERGGNLTSEQCRALTSEERIEMLQRGALIYDDIKQADYLMGLIECGGVCSSQKIFWPGAVSWEYFSDLRLGCPVETGRTSGPS